MSDIRNKILKSQLFHEIDIHFADLITKIATETGEESELLYLTAAIISHQLIAGHTSLILNRDEWTSNTFADDLQEHEITLPAEEEWLKELKKSASIIGTPAEWKPLILDGRRLYLQRHYSYEVGVAATIKEKAVAAIEIPEELTALTKKLFSDAPEKELVAKNLLSRKFSVISGGPGTGKTYTIARIMALLLTGNKNELVVLAAPTGKAASRMGQSISEAIEGLSSLVSSETVSIIQSVKQTSIHSLIGWDWYGGKNRFNRENPLPYDTVIVDEASMIDADIAFALLSALKKDARIILVGDKDQLASVEAGSVMASICASLKNGTTNRAKDAISELTVGHRFSQKSGIGRLSKAINNHEDFSEIEKIFNDPKHADELRWIVPENGHEALSVATETILDELAPYFASQTAQEAIENARNCLLLSPLRRTPFGVNALNHRIEASAKKRELINTSQKFYHLRPVLITQNDYTLSLYNGDFGVMIEEKSDKTKVWFQTTEGISAFSPYYLPPHETVYAMTVHKSQGSEFNHVILILPDHDIPLLTIELIYTAITRAKKKFTLISSAEVFKQAVSRRIVRSSGLEERLWNKE